MFNKQTIKDVKVKNQVVLIRTDYNVPLQDDPEHEGCRLVADDLRIRASLPTLQHLLQQGARNLIIISHLGRPEGKDKSLSLKPVAAHLQSLLPDVKVAFADDVSGPDVEFALADLPKGSILVLENLRFFSGEESNSEEFAREIVDSTHATVFVQDGFAVLHRAHASTSALADILPTYAGLLVEKEVTTLEKTLTSPARPFAFVLGGAKVEDKQPLIDKFTTLADTIIIGGKIAADGYTSDNDKIYVANDDFDEDSSGAKLDLGPLATHQVLEKVRDAKTVLWNGLLGYAEDPAYATSSTALGQYLGEHPEVTSVICGGDTTAFVNHLTAEHPALQFSLISTGGGAALTLLAGAELPGLDAILDK